MKSVGGNGTLAGALLGHTSPWGQTMTVLERASVCTLDCPDTCSLTVTVDEGRIIKVRGSSALPYTDGVICNKVAHHSAEFVHGRGRLHFPMKRSGARGSGQFERITWTEALDTIQDRKSTRLNSSHSQISYAVFCL